MGKEQELKQIIDNPWGNYREQEDAIQDLAQLGTKEAMEIIAEIERNPRKPDWLRTMARGYLARKRS